MTKSALRHVAAGWAAFAGTHLAMSHPPVREELVRTMGEKPFQGVYSIVALGTFLPTTIIYARSAAGVGVIPGWTAFSRSFPARLLGTSFKLGGAFTLGQTVARAEFPPTSAEPGEKEVRGIERVTRHPAFTSFALLGIGNIFTRGHTGDVIYWSGFPLFWFVGCMHQDERLRSVLPQKYFEETSLIPFQAIFEGRNSLKLAIEELNRPAAAMTIMAPLFLL